MLYSYMFYDRCLSLLSLGKCDLYSHCILITITSSIVTGTGVAGGVRISLAPGYVFPSGIAGLIHSVLSGKLKE